MEYKTTFMMDFAIADKFGNDAIQDTYNRAFEEWKTNYEYLTELVIVLNLRCWHWYYRKNLKRSQLYADLYYQARDYALDNLKGDEFDYFFNMTD